MYYRSIGLWWSLNFQRQLKCSDYFVIRLYCVSVFGLDCYQCNSTLDSNCQDRFNHDQSINPIRSTKCTVYNSRYCIKITGVWGGKILPIQIIYIQDLEVHAYFLQTTIEWWIFGNSTFLARSSQNRVYSEMSNFLYVIHSIWKPKGQNYFKGFRNPAAIRNY